jgi:HD-like signal output (HDOD) protein
MPPVADPPATRQHTATIARELDQARRNGPLKTIVVPPCPALLVQLREALSAAVPDLTAVARIASSDVAMSATLIRQANSARHNTGQPVRSIGQALTRLGLDTTAAAMTAFLASSAIHPDKRHLARFWETSGERGTAMGLLSRRLPGLSPDVAQTCGLFLHVGLPVMLQSLRGYGGTMVEAQARRDRTYVQTENANHRTDHAVVGALVARVWQLAPEVMATIRLHHDLDALADDRVEPEVRSYVALALVAELLLRRRESLPPDAEWNQHGAAALSWLGIDESELDLWHDQLCEAFEADAA